MDFEKKEKGCLFCKIVKGKEKAYFLKKKNFCYNE